VTFANLAGLWFLLAMIPIVLLHILKPRRVEAVISSQLLWSDGSAGSTAASPWQRLRPSLPLLLQLLAVAALAIALANPVSRTATALASHTVVVVDTSASMAALDGTPTRLDSAKSDALALWDALPTDATISLVSAGPTPRVLLTASRDQAAYEAAVRSIRGTDGPADLAAAMSLADGLETPERTIGIVLVSDGQHPADELATLPLGVAHRLIGSDDVNRAITDLVVVPDDDGLEATVTLRATGGPAVTAPLRFDVDGRTAEVIDVEIPAEGPAVVTVDLPQGERVIARLGGEDLLAIDNTAYAVARQRRTSTVAVVGEVDTFLQALLVAAPGIAVVDPAEQTPDVVIYNRTAVPDDVARPFLAIVPPGGVPGVEVVGEVDAPIPTLVRTNHPILAGLDLSSLRIASAQRVEAPTAETLIGAEAAPLVARGTRVGVPFIYFAFDVARSTLPLDVSFPVMGERIIAELAGAGSVPRTLKVGDGLRPPVGQNITVADPTGTERSVPIGGGTITVDRPGFWSIESTDRAAQTVAVQLPTAESALAPLPVAPTEPRPQRGGEDSPQRETSWRWVAVVAALAIGLAEWFVSRRRIAVPRRQWRASNTLRLAALALLALALLGVSWPRTSGSVATVFVLDRSASVGSQGASAGLDVVSAAQRVAPDDASLGVVVFGDGARVERLLSPVRSSTGLQATSIGDGRTDLAAGLRLAGAVLPDDQRRRVVIVSDGRTTIGDAEAEALRLAERGIEVDYVALDDARRADASVEVLQAPGQVDAGTSVAISATIRSTAAQPGTVTLLRNGQIVGSTTVDLNEGLTTVTLRDAPDESGLQSYDVNVSVALDDQPQNDSSRTTVEVTGAAGVLVVQGADGVATSLSAGLEAAGLQVDTIRVNELRDLDQLAGYDVTVLVDVDAADLNASQMSGLVQATRDLGRGLVTVGGTQSFGMGGYRDTELEGVLPVISDILDPERRRTVAEVLAIDTSESMGECHCDEGFSGMGRNQGGVNKTDVARAGAARAIAALGEADQVGVLAVDTQTDWVIDLQELPSDEVVTAGLSRLTPSGGTNLRTTLSTAAEALRESQASLKHIILFSDGFTEPGALDDIAAEAAGLLAEGITVSVVATGEGAARELRPIAVAGGGRFYPGRDLNRIPEILTQEAIIAARDFVTEGEFLPIITSASPVVAPLSESPPLLGYVATTAQPTARTLLAIGEENDPLLVSWQVGLGRSTAFTSDAGLRWSQAWTSWDGYVDFWSRVVRDAQPVESGGTVRAVVDGDEVRIRVEVPEGAEAGSAAANVWLTEPDGQRRNVPVRRTGDNVFEAIEPVDAAGTYTVGSSVGSGDDEVVVGSALATKSYAAEYQPGSSDTSALARVSQQSNGRGAIDASQAFDDAGLAAGSRQVPLTTWFLLAAALSWLLAAAVARLWLRRSAGAPSSTGGSRSSAQPSSERKRSVGRARSMAPDQLRGRSSDADRTAEPATADRPSVPKPDAPDVADEPAPLSTVEELLRSKREGR